MTKKTLPSTESSPSTSPPKALQPIPRHLRKLIILFGRIGSYTIFWLWNLCFLLLLYGFVLPMIGYDLLLAVLNGEIAAEMLLTLVGVILVPTVCAIAGAWPLRRSPLRLGQLFFGVEAPLLLLLGLRVGLLRELTDASYFLLGTFIITILAFTLSLWRPEWSSATNKFSRVLGWLQGAIHSLMLILGFYVAVLLVIYTIPTIPDWISIPIDALFDGHWIADWHSSPWQNFYESAAAFIMIILGLLSLIFLFAMPVIFGWLYSRMGLQGYQTLVRRQGRGIALVVVLSTLMAWFVIFGGVNRQPQVAAFAQVRAATTPAAQTTLLQNENAVRRGLVNAYLNAYRYLAPNRHSVNVQRLYSYAFYGEPAQYAWLQNIHDWLISPFLYDGVLGDDARAAAAYAKIFDAPIQKAEQKAVLKAMKSTVQLDAANAGVLDIGRQKVQVVRQDLTIDSHPDYLDVELYEVYENQTHEVEEIFYGFTLPPNAVVTGVWLGETYDRSNRYPFQVAPRGAAQKVYNSQVQRARPVDPALLEQVGPDQYRLRAFPIPPKLNTWEQQGGTDRPTQMHLWLTYRLVPQADAGLLPRLTEARNVYWTKDTIRLRNGKPIQGFESWFEGPLAAISLPQQLPKVTVAGYDLTATAVDPAVPLNFAGQQIALILDTSYSMGQHREALQTELDWLREQGLLDGDRRNGEVSLYALAAGATGPQAIEETPAFTAQDPLFYGVVHLQDLVRSGAAIAASGKYDALILLSDEGSYELAKDEPAKPLPVSELPIWTVHLGTVPAAYDDATLKAIQDSRGTVTRSIAAALQQWQQQTKLAENEVVAGVWRWQLNPNPEAANTETGLEPIAARLLVDHLAQQVNANDPEALDQLHTIAQEQAIVTPYSSMIVLVNDEQREMLKKAEAEGDRFARTVESGEEEIQQPASPLAVPEPGFWVGTLVATGFFVLQRRRRRR
ncbi:MAG: TIGR02921 family PEP-CTERM protein [Spirulina sp. SIO3F2]|nr:TIGR02921 family PEP-CTERM protein [Spirulina sp. SIO3F2]